MEQERRGLCSPTGVLTLILLPGRSTIRIIRRYIIINVDFRYLIPLSAFNAVNGQITDILFQDQTSSATNTYYFDDIEFRKYVTPNATQAIKWSGNSIANLRNALPTSMVGTYQVTDNLLVPTSTPVGTYLQSQRF